MREARVGDRVRVNGGPYDEKVGRVVMVKTPEDVLFEGSGKPIAASSFFRDKYGSPLDMALVELQSPIELQGGTVDQIGVPIKRLEVI